MDPNLDGQTGLNTAGKSDELSAGEKKKDISDGIEGATNFGWPNWSKHGWKE